MLTKREIYQAAGISDSTFLHWRRMGLIPPPIGIRKREALFHDDVLDLVMFILARQKEGMKLNQIAEEINEENERERTLNEAQAEELKGSERAEKEFNRGVCSLLNIDENSNISSLRIDNEDSYSVVWSGEGITIANIRTANSSPESIVWAKTINYEELGLLIGGIVKNDCIMSGFPDEALVCISKWLYLSGRDRIDRAFEYVSKTYSYIDEMRNLAKRLK